MSMASILKCFMTHYGSHIAELREEDDEPYMLRFMQNPDGRFVPRPAVPQIVVDVVRVAVAAADQSVQQIAEFAQKHAEENEEGRVL